MNPSLVEQVKKADFSVIINHSGHLVFAVESKSERTKSKSKGDLTKMARYLKDTLDSIEADEFKEAAIAGMITSGVMSLVYVLEHRHDYVYTLFRQDCLYSPSIQDLPHFSNC